jgi:hypothetical protein
VNDGLAEFLENVGHMGHVPVAPVPGHVAPVHLVHTAHPSDMSVALVPHAAANSGWFRPADPEPSIDHHYAGWKSLVIGCSARGMAEVRRVAADHQLRPVGERVLVGLLSQDTIVEFREVLLRGGVDSEARDESPEDDGRPLVMVRSETGSPRHA